MSRRFSKGLPDNVWRRTGESDPTSPGDGSSAFRPDRRPFRPPSEARPRERMPNPTPTSPVRDRYAGNVPENPRQASKTSPDLAAIFPGSPSPRPREPLSHAPRPTPPGRRSAVATGRAGGPIRLKAFPSNGHSKKWPSKTVRRARPFGLSPPEIYRALWGWELV